MVDRDDIFHLLRITQTWQSFRHSVALILRHAVDKLLQPRSTRLVMGNAMIARMLYSYLEHGGLLVLNTEVKQFLHDGQCIHGVVLQQRLADGSVVERSVRSKGGVIMASGGFNRHPTRHSEMLPGAQQAWCPAAPGHTGALQDLALALGAQMGQGALSHAFWAPVSTRQRADGSTAVFPHFVMDRGKPGMITVDSQGQRYLNESTSYHLFGIAMQAHHAQTPSVPSWLVCDAAALKRYGLGMIRPGGKGLAPFLQDGYLKQGQSVQELAQQIQVPPQKLQASIERFNDFAERGIDEDFLRGSTDYERANGDANWPGPNPCLGALRQGPFYAIALYPGDIGAATGLLTDEHARVLNAQGRPIEGLYACGNDMHSIMGGVYPAPGITLGPGLTFAYIAARHALQRAQQD
jgi:succinate dehydrogenase/fumarate reductase flavoprotein subunit